jgi:hypothetical protein
MTALQLLKQIAPPPSVPTEAQGDWKQVEATIGLTLPDDYKNLISQYGTGRFSDFLYAFNPFSVNECLNLINSSQRILEGERKFKEEFPFPLFPEPNGLFPWGSTDNGNYLYWHTKGEPRDWAVIVCARETKHKFYEMSTTQFLEKWLSRELICQVFPDNNEYFPDAAFEQYRKLEHISIYFNYVCLAYEQRLELIWNYLGRGKVKGMPWQKSRSQCHFVVDSLNSESTYWDNINYGSILRLAYPQERENEVRKKIFELSRDLTLPIKQILDYTGNAWS